MMISQKLDSFLTLEAFLKMPDTQPASEYFNGKIYQKTMPQGEHSILQSELVSYINQRGKQNQTLYAFPELRCNFCERSIVPDLAVFRWNRIPRTSEGKVANRFDLHPDWIIEILSPEQSMNQVINKILFCLKQGTELGWLIDSQDESVMILKPHQLPEIISGSSDLPTLDGLENWQLSSEILFNGLRI